MKLTKTNTNEVLNELIKRVKDIEQRERIVLKMPFGCSVNRIEIYCSETPTQDNAGSVFFGEKFDGVLTIQQFNDYTNKSYSKSSFSYKNEFLQLLPKLIERLSNLINQ